jgi:hypothetical protein
MKKMLLFIVLSLVLLLVGCNYGIRKAPQQVRKTFETMFPGATLMEWERDYNTYKAEFLNEGRESECWFSKEGSWLRTKTKLAFFDIPAPVLSAAREYSGWEIDEVYLCEQENGVPRYYQIEYDHEHLPGEKKIGILPDGTAIMDF